MKNDLVDSIVQQWKQQRPDLDSSPLEIVHRLLMLCKPLEHSADRALAPFGLTLWQYDVLAALRRSGPPFTLSPTQLMNVVILTSGAMTNRIDRLEQAGLIERRDEPSDGRGVRITLTRKGRQLVDRATRGRLENARRIVHFFTPAEQKQFASLLRRTLASITKASTHDAKKRRAPAGARRSRSAFRRNGTTRPLDRDATSLKRRLQTGGGVFYEP